MSRPRLVSRGPVTPGRREFLQVGCLGGLGLSLGSMFRMQAARADAKSFNHFTGTNEQHMLIF